MSYNTFGALEELRNFDISGCVPVPAAELADGRPWPARAEAAARGHLREAGLEGLLDDGRIFLTGGAVLRLVSGSTLANGDLDIYPVNWAALEAAEEALAKAGYGLLPSTGWFVRVWRHEYLPEVQLVCFMDFPTMASAIGRHDLHVCQWGLAADGIWGTKEAYTDARHMQLTVNHAIFPDALLWRFWKYSARGYCVTPQALGALIRRKAECRPILE